MVAATVAALLLPGSAFGAPADHRAAAGTVRNGSSGAPPTSSPAARPGSSPTSSPAGGKTTLPAGSLVHTGGFEPPDVDTISGYDTYTAKDHPRLGAWTITAGSVDLIGAGWEDAAEGKQYIDLNGNDGGGTAATITQTLDTTAGRRYRLEFLLAGNPHGDPPVKDLQVRWGTRTTEYKTDAASGDTLNWRPIRADLDACTAGTELVFTSRTTGERGPLIDAVSVVDAGPAAACGGGTAWWQVGLLSGLGLIWVAAMVVLGLAVLARADRRRQAPPARA